MTRSRGKNFLRQLQPRRKPGVARAFEIFRRRAQHGGTADVDVLDELFGSQSRLSGCRLERVKVHYHKIDRSDAVFLRLLLILRMFPPKEQAAVHLWMQRFHASAKHFGPAGEVGNIAHRDAVFAQELCGSAGRKNFDLPSRKTFGKVDDSSFVKNTEERPLYCHESLRNGSRTV